MADLKTLQLDIHENARKHGFWDDADNANIPTKLALIHAEVSEALEEFRMDRMDLYYEDRGMKIGYAAEISDFGRARFYDSRMQLVTAEEATDRKPEGFGIELADALIRILDLAAFLGLDMGALVELKMAYNETRPFKHGGRRV